MPEDDIDTEPDCAFGYLMQERYENMEEQLDDLKDTQGEIKDELQNGFYEKVRTLESLVERLKEEINRMKTKRQEREEQEKKRSWIYRKDVKIALIAGGLTLIANLHNIISAIKAIT